MTATEILDVDLLAFERDPTRRRSVVDGVMRSLATGFVYTTADLPADLLDTAYGMLGEFFGLDLEIKSASSAPGTHGQTGYTAPLVERAAGRAAADWKEMLNWGQELDPGHPLRRRFPHRYADRVLPEAAVAGIGDVLGDLHLRLVQLQQRFLRVIASGLGVDEEYFDEMTRDGASLSRAIHYPPMAVSPGDAHVWAAEHADINLITALPRATAPGLQVQLREPGVLGWQPDAPWVDVAPPEGRVVINTGIMIERITNGRLPAGWHRVIAGGSDRSRLSVVQFLHPTPWTQLAALPSCIDAANPLRWSPIQAGDLLDQVLWDIGLIDSRPES